MAAILGIMASAECEVEPVCAFGLNKDVPHSDSKVPYSQQLLSGKELTMWDFNLGAAFGLIMRTLPFILLRLLVYVGIALGYMLVTGTGAGIGYGIGSLFGEEGQFPGAGIGGFLGFSLFGAAMYWARSWLLYMVKAAHIAVLVELLDGQPIPDGQSQLGHGRKVVQQRFGTSNVLFGIDVLIKGVVKALSSLARGFIGALPGGDRLAGMFQAFLRMALGFVDELILARMLRSGEEESWESARKSLVLYGQNYKPMLKNAAWLAAIMYLLSILVFVVMLAPAALIAYFMPGVLSGAAVLFAVLLAWSIKAGLFEPLALICMMQVYFKAIEGQEPDPQWEAKLESMSSQFRKIKQQAAEAWSKKAQPEEAVQPTPAEAAAESPDAAGEEVPVAQAPDVHEQSVARQEAVQQPGLDSVAPAQPVTVEQMEAGDQSAAASQPDDLDGTGRQDLRTPS